jgi:rhomboid-like protein
MQSPFSNLSPVVKNLLIINVICFLPFILLTNEQYANLILSHFGLFYFNSPFFKPWQIITYMFLHGGWFHIIFNMFALFSFGPILEYSIGSKRFFNLYFICGIGAVLFQMVIQGAELHHYIGQITLPEGFRGDQFTINKIQDIYGTPVVGASGAIFGLLVAFAMLYPEMEIMVMFIPVPVKIKYAIPVYLIFEIVSSTGVLGSDDVAHLAHIGGALFGFMMVKIWGLGKSNNYR